MVFVSLGTLVYQMVYMEGFLEWGVRNHRSQTMTLCRNPWWLGDPHFEKPPYIYIYVHTYQGIHTLHYMTWHYITLHYIYIYIYIHTYYNTIYICVKSAPKDRKGQNYYYFSGILQTSNPLGVLFLTLWGCYSCVYLLIRW